MADDVRPALTPEEWRQGYILRKDADIYLEDGAMSIQNRESMDSESTHGDKARHEIAALALHGMPFGFTWEMVDALRKAVDALYVRATEYMSVVERWNVETPEMQLVSQAADRIAALLPPRETPK